MRGRPARLLRLLRMLRCLRQREVLWAGLVGTCCTGPLLLTTLYATVLWLLAREERRRMVARWEALRERWRYRPIMQR